MLDEFFSNPFYRKNRGKLLFIADAIIIIISYILAYWVRNDFSFKIIKELESSTIIIFGLFVLFTYAIVFYLSQIYKSLWTFITTNEILRLSMASIVVMAIVMLTTYVVTKEGYYLSVIFNASLLALLAMFSFRVAYRLYRSRVVQSREQGMKRVVIIGAGAFGNLLLREIHQNKNLKYQVIGFIDDMRSNLIVSGVPVIGTVSELKDIKEKHHIDQAIIAIKHLSQEERKRIISYAQDADLEVKVMDNPTELISNPNAKHLKLQDVKIEDLLGRGEIKLNQQEIHEYLEGKVVCVTGAGGSIGSELCRQITRFKPKQLVMIDLNENALYMLEQEFMLKKRDGHISDSIEHKAIIASIRDKETIMEVFAEYQPAVVFHAAAHKHVPLMETRPKEAIKNNVFGTHNVITSCIENHVERFILISTDKAVNPTNVMGATKRMTEMILQAYGNNGITKLAAVRFGNVLGSNGSVIPIFKEQIANGGPVTLTHKDIIRYFMTIPEAAQLVLQAGYYAHEGEIFVLDMGEPVKILDLAEKLIRLSGYVPYEDIQITEIGLRPGEKMFEELHLDNEETSKTKNDLIFLTKPMEITIDEILEKFDILTETLDKEHSCLDVKETILKVIK
ncbi:MULTISPECIES: nucleoside-diphosphate sugar epimerase/dehydratase [unclassified Breznakia]|uniref:nucleoside-diphosphate sugar epimerase/dehydratase n=1 Tax=unclassified Breznakia TaxID=2623764 RepID=UPI00247308E7|nr:MULTISPECIES: nucleoside-diphosphate sugar epimerase/dehydratase [unclassified Breznakia]MDH6366288.1 FlaA1/EpsC-like NDP-sugar epimerase [Breznakia sp. PH1-1]MDH6403381.1 FlaA1/EpsC-like NDP-sugar epimerase [Breznakia sp. PF1-11]MDH6411090.1 FlaA1/EpsC-like NDP-sugar epimerase [Breznakia sp. PFB1-11]MDH6413454.1 FlaA1/EpsC-like NDP-sugar epimerase [Breznakia sp. PFB1-14]MDH6416757.1 FlaA1/EpsC-like NDP-sugar epimerase [Breznakia sp. PFB1-4]